MSHTDGTTSVVLLPDPPRKWTPSCWGGTGLGGSTGRVSDVRLEFKGKKEPEGIELTFCDRN